MLHAEGSVLIGVPTLDVAAQTATAVIALAATIRARADANWTTVAASRGPGHLRWHGTLCEG